MIALFDLVIDTNRLFNTKWYVAERMEKMGYSKEDLDGGMCANTYARIEKETSRTLIRALQPKSLCVAQFQVYVFPKTKSKTSIRKKYEKYAMMQPVLPSVVRASQVTQDQAADDVH